MEFIDVSAKTIEDAMPKGVAQLAVDGQELVETKVLEQPLMASWALVVNQQLCAYSSHLWQKLLLWKK